jgi:hypothetical protein
MSISDFERRYGRREDAREPTTTAQYFLWDGWVRRCQELSHKMDELLWSFILHRETRLVYHRKARAGIARQKVIGTA